MELEPVAPGQAAAGLGRKEEKGGKAVLYRGGRIYTGAKLKEGNVVCECCESAKVIAKSVERTKDGAKIHYQCRGCGHSITEERFF